MNTSSITIEDVPVDIIRRMAYGEAFYIIGESDPDRGYPFEIEDATILRLAAGVVEGLAEPSFHEGMDGLQASIDCEVAEMASYDDEHHLDLDDWSRVAQWALFLAADRLEDDDD